jgi:hypothetical protein
MCCPIKLISVYERFPCFTEGAQDNIFNSFILHCRCNGGMAQLIADIRRSCMAGIHGKQFSFNKRDQIFYKSNSIHLRPFPADGCFLHYPLVVRFHRYCQRIFICLVRDNAIHSGIRKTKQIFKFCFFFPGHLLINFFFQ